ncbi:MAG: NAD(P)/FAD-dependent oxidoreductase [Deltaproteobacteria bacterium]|nr:NAD(P)/FAD-dependent oxidoreductase [Deltaproteobacteria bacterium]
MSYGSQSTTVEADVAIVGAGPSGTATAIQLGQLGVQNVVLVDRHDFPRDKTCGSGISPKGIKALKALGVWEAIEPEAYRVSGLRLVTPGDREAYLSGGDAAAAVICLRRHFDHTLLKRAQALGTTFVPHVFATELLTERGRVVGFRCRDDRVFRARHVVVAGGSHCTFGVTRQPRRIIQAIMGWWENVPFRPHHVEMVFDRSIAPYYGWLFPEGEERVNIGITYEDAPDRRQRARELFQRFLDKHYAARLRHARQLGPWKGHPIIYSYAIEELTSPGRIVVGEAGRMTHPATAEGIYQGMRSGMLAAEALASMRLGGVTEPAAMARYERACRRAFLASFWGGGLFRRFVKTPAMDWILATGQRPAVQGMAARLMARM